MLKSHPYIPNASSALEEMLRDVGVSDVEELFKDLPKLPFEIKEIPKEPMDELSVEREVMGGLSKNVVFRNRCFVGGGPWFHHIPSVIKHIISRGEFLTSYTPYQAEVSQGVLQSLFEFQSMICELYDMEVANASMYDLPTSIGEATLLCSRVTGRRKVIIPSSLPRERKSVIANYTQPQGLLVKETPYSTEDGCLDQERLKGLMDSDVACVYAESPSYFGIVDEGIKAAVDAAHDFGALAVVGSDPLSLGVFKPPGEFGADIAVGDGQPLGISPGLGGNSLGIMACRDDPRIIRQMPGRIVGLTQTKDGTKRGFVLALSTREQHIRREKATSNICTNETLLALAATVYMSLMGRDGMVRVARTILGNTKYTIDKLKRAGLAAPVFRGTNFRDFAVSLKNVDEINKRLLKRRLVGGRDLSKDFPDLKGVGLFAVTEIHTREEIDVLVSALREIARGT
ncbi:MAG: aminomethyl-transferring glycine dehydrogenase subunit GcvPA [Candidatus Verstraetearchaeota archaeon]|nr:aminomethyl-transferring glycine dehydrogenase subunit GcvPA [Candidatus Verstraetearchaeota archaeon]